MEHTDIDNFQVTYRREDTDIISIWDCENRVEIIDKVSVDYFNQIWNLIFGDCVYDRN